MKQLRIYTDGVFDLCHYGHGRVFEQIKEKYPDCYLIVGVANDEDCEKYKGITVMTMEERIKCLKYNKYVDEVLPNGPWIVTKEFIETHNIDYCSHHDNGVYNSDIDGNLYAKSIGKFFSITYTDEISTTNLIDRILNNYDKYIQRNKNKNKK